MRHCRFSVGCRDARPACGCGSNAQYGPQTSKQLLRPAQNCHHSCALAGGPPAAWRAIRPRPQARTRMLPGPSFRPLTCCLAASQRRPYTPTSEINQRGHVDFVIKMYTDGQMSQVLVGAALLTFPSAGCCASLHLVHDNGGPAVQLSAAVRNRARKERACSGCWQGLQPAWAQRAPAPSACTSRCCCGVHTLDLASGTPAAGKLGRVPSTQPHLCSCARSRRRAWTWAACCSSRAPRAASDTSGAPRRPSVGYTRGAPLRGRALLLGVSLLRRLQRVPASTFAAAALAGPAAGAVCQPRSGWRHAGAVLGLYSGVPA